MTIDAEIFADLRDPRAYPHAPSCVDVVQTHISCVFLAGDEVFKVKKPVCFSFLDFSTLDRRRHFCHEEVRLNRRLAPEVYRGVVPIVRTPEGHRIGGDGPPVEYAVHMRRLAPERLLSAVVERGEADAVLMERIASTIAAFHASPETEPATTDSATPEALAQILAETFAGLRSGGSGAGLALDDLRRLTNAALARVADTLRRRRAGGRVREGHGDLRPDHICCSEGMPIIDCVEFSASLRTCDVASELAFLVSELEFAPAPDLVPSLVAAYVDASGDAELRDALPFFCAYRAEVRALVATLTAGEPEVDAGQRARQREDARRYLALAARHAWRAQGPLVVAVMGQSGSGKSTLATTLAHTTGFPLLRSDVLRKRLAGLAALERPATPEALARLYSPEHSTIVYGALVAEAEQVLAGGSGIIVDGTFQRRRDRDRLRELATRAAAPLLWIECRANAATIHERLQARAARNDDPSDATATVADEQARRFEPLIEGPEPRLCIATDMDASAAATAEHWLVQQLAAGMDGMDTAC